MVVHGDSGQERHSEGPRVITPEQQSFIVDPTVVSASSIQRRQQVFVQEEVIVSGYAHDHAIKTAAETEKHLGCHLREYLDGTHAYYDASMKNQGELQSVELDRRLGCLERDVHERAQASAVDTARTMANKLESHFNSALATMETSYNAHNTTYVSECETRLQSALNKSKMILRQLQICNRPGLRNVSMPSSMQPNRPQKLSDKTTCDRVKLGLMSKTRKLVAARATELAQSYADNIERRRQKKLDDTIEAFEQHTKSDIDTRLVNTMARLEHTHQGAKDELKTTFTSSTSALEKNLQYQRQAAQNTTATKIHCLEQELRDLKNAAQENKIKMAGHDSQLTNLEVRLHSLGSSLSTCQEFSEVPIQQTSSNREGIVADTTASPVPFQQTSSNMDVIVAGTTASSASTTAPASTENNTLTNTADDVQSIAVHQVESLVATPPEESAVLTALAHLSRGINELLVKAQPSSKSNSNAVTRMKARQDKISSFPRRQNVLRNPKLGAKIISFPRRQKVLRNPKLGASSSARTENDGTKRVGQLVRARAKTSKQAEQRIMQRERELRRSGMLRCRKIVIYLRSGSLSTTS
ncbi:hypothetical protein GN958_ATG08381 [Phytophthora infestans]|uniref:Uncharacterized protein n=1 Tax=Phytophthora infestans TaxID=4787 RepID=A0A8S9UMZ7_PHYIN|nr:hypothetical protein GN958_ATG08381 [Phytophthora infestans]